MVLTMETQGSPEGFPRISMVPPLADPCPSHPQEGIRKEERGKEGPHRKEKGKKMKKHRKTTLHCDKQIQGSKTRVQCAVTGGAYGRALYPGF